MAGSLLNLGGYLGPNGDPCQYFVSAAADATTGRNPLFAQGELGKYFVVQGTPASIPYTGGLAKNGTRVYQLVKLDPAATATFGHNLIWKDYSDYLVTNVGATTKQNSSAGLLISGSITAAGAVTSKTIDAVNGNYILMAVDGIFPFMGDAGAVVIESLIHQGVTTTGLFSALTPLYVTAVTARVVGVAVTAKATAHQGVTTAGAYAHGSFHYPKLVSF